MRSGLTNPNIGRNLRLHPVTGLMGVFPERVEPWTGTLQTRYSDQFADIEGGYGVKFETAPIHFALPASAYGWEGAGVYHEDVERLAHTSVVGMLLRDRDAGRVDVTGSGNPRVHYDLSQYDAGHVHAAIRGAAEVLSAAGATEIVSLHSPPVRAFPDDVDWIQEFHETCASRGYRRNRMSFISFHQMGTAAMGADQRKSVIGATGETHEVPGLYVADASAFPTSSGVNPMITIMAIADHVARSIAGD
jgi:choline dehydrogenase-like flavoprotein